MTHIQQMIEDAIKGGWTYGDIILDSDAKRQSIPPQMYLLDPLSWQAVGKTRRWVEYMGIESRSNPTGTWRWYMHRFIDHLADGDDIETALSKIS